MTLRAKTLVFLPMAALAAAGCSAIDCEEPFAYHDARLGKPIAVPDGLVPPATSDSYAIPGTPPGEGYKTGACLVRPPQLVEPPAEAGDEAEDAPPPEPAKG